jgi:hypothetical protein
MGSSLKTIIYYLIMMGLPLLGVLFILQIGSTLHAPVSVGGDWQLSINKNPGCQLADATLLRISQSGPNLFISMSGQPDISLAGRLDGQELHTNSLSAETTLELTAVIHREVDPNRLEGAITVTNCPAPVLFSATRLPKPETSQPGQ